MWPELAKTDIQQFNTYFFKYPTCIRSYLEIESYCLKNIVYEEANTINSPVGMVRWGVVGGGINTRTTLHLSALFLL